MNNHCGTTPDSLFIVDVDRRQMRKLSEAKPSYLEKASGLLNIQSEKTHRDTPVLLSPCCIVYPTTPTSVHRFLSTTSTMSYVGFELAL